MKKLLSVVLCLLLALSLLGATAENVVIEAGATVRYAILDAGVSIGRDAVVGEDRATASEVAVVGADVAVPAGKVIEAGAMISEM